MNPEELVIDKLGWIGVQFWALFHGVQTVTVDDREYVDMKTDGGTVIRVYKEQSK